MPKFRELAAALPPQGYSDDPDVQARQALWLIVDAVERHPSCPPPPEGGAGGGVASHPVDVPAPNTCPNCGQPATSTRTPYCSDACKEMSAFIRQFRNSLATGVALTPERQVMLGEKLWHLLGGGYPRRQAMAPKASLKSVWKREDGRCQICGEPAVTIDHTGSG